MSMAFRTIGNLSRVVSQAMAPSAVLILVLVTYTGFTIPMRDMRPWFRWINYLNPVAYGFESDDKRILWQKMPCTQFVPIGPGYFNVTLDQRICSTTGAVAGADFVDGDTYLRINFKYEDSYLWR
jgi:ABC-type multidrug transport system permease subunit